MSSSRWPWELLESIFLWFSFKEFWRVVPLLCRALRQRSLNRKKNHSLPVIVRVSWPEKLWSTFDGHFCIHNAKLWTWPIPPGVLSRVVRYPAFEMPPLILQSWNVFPKQSLTSGLCLSEMQDGTWPKPSPQLVVDLGHFELLTESWFIWHSMLLEIFHRKGLWHRKQGTLTWTLVSGQPKAGQQVQDSVVSQRRALLKKWCGEVAATHVPVQLDLTILDAQDTLHFAFGTELTSLRLSWHSGHLCCNWPMRPGCLSRVRTLHFRKGKTECGCAGGLKNQEQTGWGSKVSTLVLNAKLLTGPSSVAFVNWLRVGQIPKLQELVVILSDKAAAAHGVRDLSFLISEETRLTLESWNLSSLSQDSWVVAWTECFRTQGVRASQLRHHGSLTSPNPHRIYRAKEASVYARFGQ